MTKNINISITKQYHAIKKELEADGYKKTADCYWAYIFEKGDSKVIINRE